MHCNYDRGPTSFCVIRTCTTEYICYDDACHLKRFARNPVRKDLTLQTKQLASVEMAVDKMHMKGHTDPWCKANCDPGNFKQLNKVLHRQIRVVYILLILYLGRH